MAQVLAQPIHLRHRHHPFFNVHRRRVYRIKSIVIMNNSNNNSTVLYQLHWIQSIWKRYLVRLWQISILFPLKIFSMNSIHRRMVRLDDPISSYLCLSPFFFLGSSSFPGQFVRPDVQAGQINYAETVGYYSDEIVNTIDSLQTHHPAQNYAHLSQSKRKTLFFSLILFCLTHKQTWIYLLRYLSFINNNNESS